MTENQTLAATLTTSGVIGEWWVHGMDDGPIGPYETRAEADEDRAGVQRFLRHGHKRGYVTTDKEVKK